MEDKPKYLLKKLKSGDEGTYISLFEEYYVGLCAYSRRYVGRKDIAEDIVSETFFKIWENRKKLEITGSVKSYLFQAVANNSLNHLRKLKKEEKLEDYFSGTDNENIGFKEVAESVTENSLLIKELNSRIEEAVNLLPPQQQMVFRLKRFEGKKNKEIADEMGLAVKTVEMHLSKAVISLRKNLQDYLPAFLLFMLLK
ncbi:RNA polymerase sigma-70 factor [Draconibacterium sp. IB214405]|uniref:RNA polymerase sigma-70 factor n=1 Tax=Draconibacterium sp. IB214405 TaxID=3097352 RepID=UPI002A0C047E|nr:RNA polymerase sigma-70 factor [Draconibacterium sp. IB214405]MDX8337753.1 RNA polymerase sigma-70 factor [Draconibacterium sp. IB214405]